MAQTVISSATAGLLPGALAAPPGGRAGLADAAGAREIAGREARALFRQGPLIVVHAGVTARRLGEPAPGRSPRLLDVLELFAFVRPARLLAPSPAGLALALGLGAPHGPDEEAGVLRHAAQALLAELTQTPRPSRAEALAQAETLGRAGWAWAAPVLGALRGGGEVARPWRGDGLDVWAHAAEWEDEAPPGEAGSQPIAPEAVRARLVDLLTRAGLTEPRPLQAEFAAETVHAFKPREHPDAPQMMLAEAGTGTGKTLAYLASASVWAEANGPGVWISTFTRALQRQIARETEAVYPDPAVRARRVAVRKGRENYLCFLNLQESVNAARLGEGDLIGLMLAARWARASRDGDMTGGDFPAWLPTLFDVPPAAQASPANLVDRRGECVHAACAHYRACFVERAVRASRHADLVIANHALVMSQAARQGLGRSAGASDEGAPRRIVFDEGHHLFDAADSAFSVALSGAEAAEMRRWLRGPEARSRRGRGLEARLDEALRAASASEEIGETADAARALLQEALKAAALLPGEGWSSRIAPDGAQGEPHPHGEVEAFLASALYQVRARGGGQGGRAETQLECAARPALAVVVAAAQGADLALAALESPLKRLAQTLADLLDEASEALGAVERNRIEGVLRGLDWRARQVIPAWRAMLRHLSEPQTASEPESTGQSLDNVEPAFVHVLEAVQAFGRVVDVVYRRNWLDPSGPLHAAVLTRAHGVLVTSATLADASPDAPFALAARRTGASQLASPARTLRLASPFDYARQSLALVVTDVNRDDPRQVAAAMRELFLAARGGGLGLFTAIRRLRAVHALIAGPLADRGLPLYAQHVDPLDVGTLVDMFRAEPDSCLLGVDAVRDGVDVPGEALRLLVFDRVPWPRPDILHKARRGEFGGGAYDDALTRARLAQAFGRLIRREDDRGAFVLLDAAAPSRLFTGLPDGVVVRRMGLVEALEAVSAHLDPRREPLEHADA